MKKLQNLLMLGAIAALASCSDNDAAPNAPSADELVTVTISADLNLDTQSRATNDKGDEKVTRCLLQIVDQETDPTKQDNMSLVLTGDPDGPFTGEVRLYKNKTYDLLFWADCGAESYEATNSAADTHNLTAVTLPSNKEVSIAYAKKQTYAYDAANPETAIAAELNHAVAKVTLKTTVDLPANSVLTMSGMTRYSQYNVSGATSLGTASTDAFEFTTEEAVTGTQDGTEVFTFYALVIDATPTITLKCNQGDEIEVSNVPIKTDYHTILVGDVTGKVDATLNVTTNVNWNSNTPQETPVQQASN